MYRAILHARIYSERTCTAGSLSIFEYTSATTISIPRSMQTRVYRGRGLSSEAGTPPERWPAQRVGAARSSSPHSRSLLSRLHSSAPWGSLHWCLQGLRVTPAGGTGQSSAVS